MKTNRNTFFLLRILSLAILLLVTGCAAKDEKVPASIVGLNYTDNWVDTFSVNDGWGGNVGPHGGGGGFVCCVSIPKQWKAGLTAKIRWQTNGDEVTWKEKVIEIPQYSEEEASIFAVHFFPNDEIKVLVTDKGANHPSYPYPEPSLGH